MCYIRKWACSPINILYKYEANPQEHKRAVARSQQSPFSTLLKSHPCADTPPRMHITPAKPLSPGEKLWEIAPVCQNSFKRPKLLKISIYNC